MLDNILSSGMFTRQRTKRWARTITNHALDPAKFHLKNYQADRKLNVTSVRSSAYTTLASHRPLHLTASRRGKTLLQKQPPQEAAWYEPCPHTMRTTATALVSPWRRIAVLSGPVQHRKLVDTTLNETCRLITGCIRPMLLQTSTCCPASPEIRRSVHCQNERTKQLTDQRHSLHHQ